MTPEQTWNIIKVLLGIVGAFIGGGAFTQWVKNRGDVGSRRIDELSAYRQELRDDLRNAEEKFRLEMDAMKLSFESDIKLLKNEIKSKDERLMRAEKQILAHERELQQANTDREHFEMRVLNIIEYRWDDKGAVQELAEEIKESYTRRRRSRVSSKNIFDGYRILIVDDNQDTANLFAYSLRQVGFEVTACYGGADALQQFIMNRRIGNYFHIALVDMAMPGMSGEDLILAMRNYESENPTNSPDLKACFLTANLEKVSASFVEDNHISAAWSKPIPPDELISKVEKLLEM